MCVPGGGVGHEGVGGSARMFLGLEKRKKFSFSDPLAGHFLDYRYVRERTHTHARTHSKDGNRILIGAIL